MAADESFTRRVCAILLADVSGFSALMGEDDESTARAVGELQTLILGIVAEADGHAETAAGDAIFATFESVVAAVRAALRIQERLAEQEFAGQRLQLRIGVHFGDVLLREGAAFGDAINIAARLQTLAQPGTVCISEGVYRHVRNRFDEKFVDLGRQRLKNISDPVHAYLIVPRGAEREQSRRPSITRLGLLATGIAVVLVAAGLFVWQQIGRPPPPVQEEVLREGAIEVAPQPRQAELPVEKAVVATGPVTLGVMQFKSLGGVADDDWRREALRDGLNTQLSQLSHIKVYSKEFIDFLITRQKLSEIEVANKLGISKMLSGSFVVVGDTLRIETHVVDVATGVLESSYTTSGREEDFLELQSKVVFGAIANLDLPVTDNEKQLLLAQQRNTTVEALKLLLEAETGAGTEPSEPAIKEGMEPRSGRLRWFAFAIPKKAFAQANGDDEAAIRGLLEDYREATESGEIDSLATMYADFSAEQRAAQERYFENVRDLSVEVENVDIAVVGEEAVVSYTRTDDFTDMRTGRPMHVSVRLTKMLQRGDEGWKFAPTN